MLSVFGEGLPVQCDCSARGVCVCVCVCVYTHICICMRAFVWGCVGDIYGKVGRVQSQDLEC